MSTGRSSAAPSGRVPGVSGLTVAACAKPSARLRPPEVKRSHTHSTPRHPHRGGRPPRGSLSRPSARRRRAKLQHTQTALRAPGAGGPRGRPPPVWGWLGSHARRGPGGLRLGRDFKAPAANQHAPPTRDRDELVRIES